MALLALSSDGCSFAFSEGPPTNHQRLAYFDCTSTNAMPIVDTLIASTAAFGAAVLASAPGSQPNGDTEFAAGEVLALGASAVYGFSTAARCREAKAELFERLSAPHTAPAVPPVILRSIDPAPVPPVPAPPVPAPPAPALPGTPPPID